MCFGNMEATKKETGITQLPSWLEGPAATNVGRAVDVTSRPFEGYAGPRVAQLSGDENQAFGMLRNVAGSGNPYTSQIEDLYKKFATQAPGQINAPGFLGPNASAGTASLQDYMNPYLNAVLKPQLYDIEKKSAQDRMASNARATFSGAYGDASHGVERAKTTDDTNRLRESVIGKASSDAFNTGAGLRFQDIANLMSQQGANAQLNESGLQRMATGGTAMRDLDKYNTGREVDLANTLAGAGATERGIEQKGMDTGFQEYLREQGWDLDMVKQLTSILSGTPHGQTVEKTTEQPNNSGWQALGTIGSALLFSDRRIKTDIARVGALNDGTPVYRYRLHGKGPYQIGVMAQDIENSHPGAVHEINGIKMVDYRLATERSLGVA